MSALTHREAGLTSATEALRSGASRLQEAGVSSSRHDAEELLASALGAHRADLHAFARGTLSRGALERFSSLIERRARREPLQYILGSTGFRSIELATRPGVFIPRPETESLAGCAIEALEDLAPVVPTVLEIGTGTGVIAISIAVEVGTARIVAIDVSAEAVTLARQNAVRAGVQDRVLVVRADWLAGAGLGTRRFDVIVSNPPYIPVAEIHGLMPEVRLWEPLAALAGGEDGLTFHRALARDALELLAPRGMLLVEVADGQADTVTALLGAAGYEDMRVRKDLAGVDRVVSARAR